MIAHHHDPLLESPTVQRMLDRARRTLALQNIGNQHTTSPLTRLAYNGSHQVYTDQMAANQVSGQHQNMHQQIYESPNNVLAAAGPAQMLNGTPYLSNGIPTHHSPVEPNISALATSFGNMNMRAPSYSSASTAGSHLSAPSPTYSQFSGMQVATNQPWIPAQNLVYPTAGVPHGMPQHAAMTHAAMYHPPNHYIHQAGCPTYRQVHDTNSPLMHAFTPRGPSGELPTLITPRRDSISSNEAENLPGTPYNYSGNYPNGIAVVDRSPSAVFTHSGTPSPTQLVPTYGIQMSHLHKVQPVIPPTLSVHLQMLLEKEPKIPRAIPAPTSPAKPLDRSLENKNGETNVYLRGLMPETTDAMLDSWGNRFGDIQSSKAIIDLKTNMCKGFGFIKYHSFEDAENCIRGFHYLGYEVSFARESFYAKLKKFSDETNTNLYVSNIPRSMNEHDLSLIFAPHKVCSARILRDRQGNGRGVGFARFETRDACEEVIKIYNNKIISKGEDEYCIQIRYSDTHEQKTLKQQTAAARQYRAAEFEVGVMQARGLLLPNAQALLSTIEQRPMLSVATANEGGGDFDGHLHQDLGYVPRHSNSVLRFNHRSNLGGVSLTSEHLSPKTTQAPKSEASYTEGNTDSNASDLPVTPTGTSTGTSTDSKAIDAVSDAASEHE